MTGVIVSVETDEIAMENSQKQFIAHGQNPIDFTARERSMQEEANFDILFAVTDLLAKHLRKQHQVVVVNPDQVSILHFLADGLCEQTIGFFVGLPGRLVEGDFTGVVME
jgi:phenylpyruvate tautomerase PptA (4-oxalocrotonate tautomerase family)